MCRFVNVEKLYEAGLPFTLKGFLEIVDKLCMEGIQHLKSV